MTTPIRTTDTTVATTAVAFNFTQLFAALRASIVQQLLAVWFGLSNYRDPMTEEWMGVALPTIEAAKETSVTATQVYMTMQMEAAGVEDPSFSEVNMALILAALRDGVPDEEVYSRPFKTVWDALSKGYTFDEALQQGATRLRQLVETDIQLAHTNTSRTLLSQRSDVVGFRRVPTGDFTCALCMIASTQRYNKFDLMPIHPGCDCRVAPIISTEPVGQILDPDLLEQIHQSVEEMFGFRDRSGRVNDYRKLLVVHNHGEYGPTLAKAGNRFTVL